ncbi:MAG: hypothetical protein WDN49_17125 [Acetobacteraceae bacterium]
MPMPPTTCQKLSPATLSWNASMMVAPLNQSREQTKIARRPKRSARLEKAIVPMNRPTNRLAMKLASPAIPKKKTLSSP